MPKGLRRTFFKNKIKKFSFPRMEEVDPLDAYMYSIDAEVATLVTPSNDGKQPTSLPIVSRGEEEDEGEEEGEGRGEHEDAVDIEALKNLSVEEFIA